MRLPLKLVPAALALAATLHAADLRYWIEPCTRPETTCKSDDPQLAEWALQAWQKASGGKLHLEKSANRDEAQIRIHWASAAQGLYGEAQPIEVDGKPGAEVFVLPDLRAMGPDISALASGDSLFRDAVVYLTCLHESGHALGLSHTLDFPDIMYTFAGGGDIPEYFGRYRRLLKTRADIAKNAGMSPQDQARLVKLFE